MNTRINPRLPVCDDSYKHRAILLYRWGKPIATALVDEGDYPILSAFRWGMITVGRTNYATRSEHIKGTASGSRVIYMHRQILGLGAGRGTEVDHLDHNGLNNTRANLRVSSRSENNHNRRKFRNNKSGVPGVCFIKGRPGSAGCWDASLKLRGVYVLRKTFSTKEAAIAARLSAEREHGLIPEAAHA